jgi:hypothetical protein
MTAFCKRWPRRVAAGILVLGLTFSPTVTPTVRAQVPEETAPEGAESKGRPLDGYIGTVILVMLAFWIVAKSARR